MEEGGKGVMIAPQYAIGVPFFVLFGSTVLMLLTALTGHERLAWKFAPLPVAAMVAGLVMTLIDGYWSYVVINASGVVIITILTWDRWKRRRDKARALVGAKSRALRDALVRRVREVATPRPVLRPVPNGVGA